MDSKDFNQHIKKTYSQMTAEEKQNSQKRIADRLSNILNPKNERKQLKKKQVRAVFKQSLFSSPLKRLVLLKDYSAPNIANPKETASYAKLKQKALDFVYSIIDQKDLHNLIFQGYAGTGKTYLAISLLGELLLNNKSVLFLNMPKLKDLAFSFHDYQAQQQLKLIKSYARTCDLLILDDLGTETSNKSNSYNEASETIQQLIYDFVDSRQANFKPTLVTTNLSYNDIVSIYNSKIISRLIPKNKNDIINFNSFNDLRGRL